MTDYKICWKIYGSRNRISNLKKITILYGKEKYRTVKNAQNYIEKNVYLDEMTKNSCILCCKELY